MLELVRTKKQVSIDGKTFDLSAPSKNDAIEHDRKLKDAKEDTEKIFSIYEELFLKLGLPQDVVSSLELEHFKELSEYIMTTKKK